MSRTTTVTGTLTNGSGAPLPNQTVTATLTGANDPYITGTGSIISVTTVTTTTASDGTWSLPLLSPGDLSPSGLYWVVSALNFLLITTSFAYSSSPVVITTLSASSPTPSSSTVLVYDYIIDPAGNPLVNAPVVCKINTNAIDSINHNSVGVSAQLSTITDTNGYYAFNVIPNHVLIPSGTYYNVYENNSLLPKSIVAGDAGGLVNQLEITPSSPGAAAIAQNSIGADQTEAATFDTLTSASTVVNNMDRVRYVLASYTGAAWNTTTTFVQLNPVTKQIGNININGSITADGGFTTQGVVSIGGNATITGNLTVNGSLLGSAVPNVGTVPPGSLAYYTTPHGRQTLGSLAIFL